MAALASALAPAASSQPVEEQNELRLGDWRGLSEAWGTSRVETSEGTLLWAAVIYSDFSFTVTTDGVEGVFDLASRGLNGNPSMTMQLQSPNGSGTADFNIDPTRGVIDGTRDLLVFSVDGVTTSGQFRAAGVSVDINGTPSDVVIENTIEYLSCDAANGNWVVSVTQQIQDAGWTPSWQGWWLAYPQPPELQESTLDDLIDGMGELFEEYVDFESSLGFGSAFDPDAFSDVDWDVLLELVDRSTELYNELHNLSECDAEAIGSDAIQEWSTALAGVIGNLIITAAAVTSSDDYHVPYAMLNALIASADATGAYGAGSPLNPAIAFQTEEALITLTGQTIESNLRMSRGDVPGGATCDAACSMDAWRWAVGAAGEAASHGWTVEVFGESYGPGEVGDVLGDPPGEQ